jgi:hypothetical protein
MPHCAGHRQYLVLLRRIRVLGIHTGGDAVERHADAVRLGHAHPAVVRNPLDHASHDAQLTIAGPANGEQTQSVRHPVKHVVVRQHRINPGH